MKASEVGRKEGRKGVRKDKRKESNKKNGNKWMQDGDKKKVLLLEYQTAFVLTRSLIIRRYKQNL
jgi:hypothetical protein